MKDLYRQQVGSPIINSQIAYITNRIDLVRGWWTCQRGEIEKRNKLYQNSCEMRKRIYQRAFEFGGALLKCDTGHHAKRKQYGCARKGLIKPTMLTNLKIEAYAYLVKLPHADGKWDRMKQENRNKIYAQIFFSRSYFVHAVCLAQKWIFLSRKMS